MIYRTTGECDESHSKRSIKRGIFASGKNSRQVARFDCLSNSLRGICGTRLKLRRAPDGLKITSSQ